MMLLMGNFQSTACAADAGAMKENFSALAATLLRFPRLLVRATLGRDFALGPEQQAASSTMPNQQHAARGTGEHVLCVLPGPEHPRPYPRTRACQCGQVNTCFLFVLSAEQPKPEPSVRQANTRFVFVPGPGDPGPGDVLPRPPLPAALTGALRAAVPSAEFASNPCRLRHYMQVCSGCRAACMRA